MEQKTGAYVCIIFVGSAPLMAVFGRICVSGGQCGRMRGMLGIVKSERQLLVM